MSSELARVERWRRRLIRDWSWATDWGQLSQTVTSLPPMNPMYRVNVVNERMREEYGRRQLDMATAESLNHTNMLLHQARAALDEVGA